MASPQTMFNRLPWLIINCPHGMYYQMDRLAASRLHANNSPYPERKSGIYWSEEPYAVVLLIRNEHAAVMVIQMSLLLKLCGKETLAIGENLPEHHSPTQSSSKCTLYHICLPSDDEGYILERVEKDPIKLLTTTEKIFVGTTKLSQRGLDVLALLVMESFQCQYILTKQDCLEFAKVFCMKVAINENERYNDDQLKNVLNNLKVTEGIEGISEQISRGTSMGYSAAVSHGSSVRSSEAARKLADYRTPSAS